MRPTATGDFLVLQHKSTMCFPLLSESDSICTLTGIQLLSRVQLDKRLAFPWIEIHRKSFPALMVGWTAQANAAADANAEANADGSFMAKVGAATTYFCALPLSPAALLRDRQISSPFNHRAAPDTLLQHNQFLTADRRAYMCLCAELALHCCMLNTDLDLQKGRG